MPAGEVRVQGLRELNAAFGRISTQLKRDRASELAAAAEPVRARATDLAGSEIRNIGDQWSQMRIGVTTKVVYVAPKQRRKRGHSGARYGRPNLGTLLMNRAMQPALDEKAPEVYGLIDVMLGRFAGESGF